jgi:hypothetical protein
MSTAALLACMWRMHWVDRCQTKLS